MANEKPPAITDAPKSTPEPIETPMPTETPVPTPEATFEPEATQTPTDAPVATLAPVVLDKQQANTLTIDTVLEAIRRSDNSAAKFAIAGLESYILGMKPGMPIEKSQVAMQQLGLWKTLQNMVENTEEDFNKVFSAVLGLFHKHKEGVFHEHYVFRGMSDITLDKDEITAFLVLVNLLKVTADPVGRQQALKQNVDISRTLANVFSENARQKILAFYGM